jgi:hypothetical protein
MTNFCKCNFNAARNEKLATAENVVLCVSDSVDY